ncbi:hypothetical protein VTN77DRAFT_1893 [Rasamsonia byssochlamydoides]|uniref:uncharacterized protein n=1 Tax=Rasamsonia byssochlamydoides TaxID=89139 RepID=UPI003742D923
MAHSQGDVQVSLPPPDALSHPPSFSADPVPSADDDPDLDSGPGSPGVKTTCKTESPAKEKENFLAGKGVFRRVTLRSPNGRSKVAGSRLTLSSEELDATLKEKSHNVAAGNSSKDAQDAVPELVAPPPKARARSVSGRIANLARKTWMSSSSRSPSPAPKESPKESPKETPKEAPKQTQRRASRSREQSPKRRVSAPSAESSPPKGDPEDAKTAAPAEPTRRKSVLSKRPLSAFVSRSKPEEPLLSPPSDSLRSKTSFEKLKSLHVSTPVLPPLPRSTASSLSSSVELPRKKDELWSVFRGLEADYQKFQAKANPLKVGVIRSALLPFLNRYASHPSVKMLRPEDLDRRVNILNKWWTGLLEMLNGKNQSISGTDRPVYLEAVAGIMMRPEWKIPFQSSLLPNAMSQSSNSINQLSNSVQMQPASIVGSNSSLDSSGSDFLTESIYHNIRNIFIQNLLSQMTFVVERMSMRHAPASLVSFCGKACAYAFFFCPGVADMLVRLWNTPSDILRRVLAESGVYRGLEGRSAAQELALRFPPAVRPLAFSSHAALVRYLRQKPDMPLSTAQIPWHGPWLSRWCGRDTDLFFVFVKYFHTLFSEYIPQDTEKSKRILAPGILPVHGQLLVVLEDTLYRQSGLPIPENPHAVNSITFDDFMEGPDTSVSALPLGSANCHRSMAENRLIMLLRDILSESSQEPAEARRLYAESFTSILKAAARRTSLFDHNACFVLCDFIEEALTIITRYCQSIQTELFDWKFWLDVCKQMTRSHNSLTDVRVFAFIYCVWTTWTSNEERKRDLCLGFLLHEDFFYRYFSHWSPMVRAYFHRLLCWRVARFNSDPSPTDSEIYETLLDRLEQIWAYYLSFQAAAAKELKAPMSSAPCSPAPGRRIIIIRSDNQPSPSSLFASLDRAAPPASTLQAGFRSHGILKLDPQGLPPESNSPPRRRWSILRSMFGGSATPKPSEDSPPSSSSDESEGNSTETAKDASRRSSQSSSPGSNSNSSSQSTDDSDKRPPTPHQPFCFRFSLEWLDRPQWPSKNKRLFTPSLPVGAQLHVQHRRSLANLARADQGPEDAIDMDADGGDQRDTDGSTAGTQESLVTSKTSVEASSEVEVRRPRNERLVASKYAGRALAEWAQVVSECDNFFERRRDEGVPSDRLVETPTLGVDSFRK